MNEEAKIAAMKTRYETAKSAAMGQTVLCPTCENPFVKTHPKQAFCRRNGNHGNKCRDRYHNIVNPNRRKRAYAFAFPESATHRSSSIEAMLDRKLRSECLADDNFSGEW